MERLSLTGDDAYALAFCLGHGTQRTVDSSLGIGVEERFVISLGLEINQDHQHSWVHVWGALKKRRGEK